MGQLRRSDDFPSALPFFYAVRVIDLFLNYYGLCLSPKEIEWAFDNIEGNYYKEC